ncbi:MAG: anthranilate synthase component I family protein [Acidobacteriota bacterium]
MIHHKTVLADLLTPVSAFLRVASASERAFLLESVEGGERIARYSFIGVDPARTFDGSFGDFRQIFPQVQAAHPGLPPFTGGAVGAFSYEMIRELERIPDRLPGTENLPSVLMDFYPTVLAFDHLRHQIVVMSHESMEKVEEIEARLDRPAPQEYMHGHPDDEETEDRGGDGEAEVEDRVWNAGGMAVPVGRVKACSTSDEFCAAVERAQEYIRAGDIFQVVLSQVFEMQYRGDPFGIYRALRYINPSPYMFFLKRGGQYIAGASPEMLVRVQGRDLEYRPIAGTRRRGRDAESDLRLERELIEDEKEKAEHLMLVDLGRNDLGRVSEYGGVRVDRMMFVERYSHVMHLVSDLKGRLRAGLDRFDALAACFPAGTVSGAPKIRAMEIIEELEPFHRGIYAGAIGYLDYSGNLDTCIAIRTIKLEDGTARIQAGAGIVADSVPEREDLECHNKARALVHAVQLAEGL